MTIQVLLADDQVMVRAGFRMILESDDAIEVVGEAADGAEAVAQCRRTHPDLVLMDVQMPGLDGIEATRRIVASGNAIAPAPRVVILTTFEWDDYLFSSLRAGASGFLLKNAPPEDLIAAVKIVAAGDSLLAPSVTRRLIAEFARQPAPSTPAPGLARLTERETEVLSLVARGLTNAEVAAELFVGEATVKSHVSSVLAKLHLRDRVQAVVFAYESGLVQIRGNEPTAR